MLLRATDPTPAIELIATFDLACRKSGLTHDQVAGLLGMTKQQLYQQLRLQGHFSLTRLVRLRADVDGRRFLREYWPLVAADMGIAEVADQLAIAAAFRVFINTLQVRIAAADLTNTVQITIEVDGATSQEPSSVAMPASGSAVHPPDRRRLDTDDSEGNEVATYTVQITVEVDAQTRHQAYGRVLHALAEGKQADVVYVDAEVIAESRGGERATVG